MQWRDDDAAVAEAQQDFKRSSYACDYGGGTPEPAMAARRYRSAQRRRH